MEVGNYRHVSLLMRYVSELRTADLIQICISDVPASILIQFCPLLKEESDRIFKQTYSNKHIQKNRQPHPLDLLPTTY